MNSQILHVSKIIISICLSIVICCNNIFAQVPNCSIQLPYQEGFNSATLSSCFSQQEASTSTSSYDIITPIYNSQSPTIQNPFEGSHMLRFRSSFIPNGIKRRLVCSPINTTNLSGIQVSFQWYQGNPNNAASNAYPTEGVQVQYSFNGSTWMDAGSFVPRHVAQSEQWSLKDINLPTAAEGQSVVYIGLLFTSNYGFNSYLDALSITANTGTPTLCLAPNASTTNSIGITTAQISWTGSTSQHFEIFYNQNNTAPTNTSSPNISNITTNNQVVTNLNANTTYYAWVRNYCGNNLWSTWTAIAPFTTLCNSTQQPNAGTISGNTQVCSGASSTYTSSVAGGVWSSSNTSIATINANGVMNAINTGTTNLTYTISNACGTASTNLNVNIVSNTPLTAINGNTSVCVGNTSSYTNSATGGTWESLQPNIATINSNGLLTALQPGIVTIKYTKNQSCGATSTTKTINIEALPTFTGIEASLTSTFNYTFLAQNANNATSYYWDFGDGGSSSLAAPSHTYTSPGDYTISLCIKNNCQQSCIETENQKRITLKIAPTTINNIKDKNAISIFPNPAQHIINWEQSFDLIIHKIEIVDVMGNILYASNSKSNITPQAINVSQFANGCYFIKFYSKSQNYNFKINIKH